MVEVTDPEQVSTPCVALERDQLSEEPEQPKVIDLPGLRMVMGEAANAADTAIVKAAKKAPPIPNAALREMLM